MIVPYQGFLGGSYLGTSPRVGTEITLNMMPELTGAPAVTPKTPIAFYATPGTRLFATAGNGPIRDLFYEDGRCFCVSGAEAYSLSAAGGATRLGAVATSQLPAKIAVNGSGGSQAMFVSGGLGYIWNWRTHTWAQITDSGFPANVQTCEFSDGYFLALGYNTRQVNYSALFNGLSWGATDLFQKSQSSDNIRNMAVVNKLIYLLGSKKTEVWQNRGDALVTFAPVQGVLIENGIDPFAGLAKVGNTLAWIGMNEHGKYRAYRDVNFQPVPISHPAVEQAWASYPRTDDAVCWTYLYRGHLLFVVSFLTAQRTWAADMGTMPPLWHEMGYLNPATGLQEAHLGRCHACAFDTHLVGSRVDGKIYELAGHYDDDTKPIRRVRRAPHIFSAQRSITIHRMALQVDAGVAAPTGQGSDPQIGMTYSVDGGKTFSNELFGSTGALGHYETEVQWDRLGQGRDWVFEFATSEPIDHAWTGASIDAAGDAS